MSTDRSTMSTGVMPARGYIVICGLLLLGTILTTALSFLQVAPVWHTVIGLAIALYQAALVLLFSMHLIQQNKVVWSVVVVSCFWVGILLVLTFTDYFTRDLTPFAPGH